MGLAEEMLPGVVPQGVREVQLSLEESFIPAPEPTRWALGHKEGSSEEALSLPQGTLNVIFPLNMSC